jgi:hypothetical protein
MSMRPPSGSPLEEKRVLMINEREVELNNLTIKRHRVTHHRNSVTYRFKSDTIMILETAAVAESSLEVTEESETR